MFSPDNSDKLEIPFYLSNHVYENGTFSCDSYNINIKDCSTIVFDKYFYKYLHSIPNNIKCIKTLDTDCIYNMPLDKLPSNLEELNIIGLDYFNHELNNLPSTLKKLSIGGIYSHSLDNLPNGLKELRLGGNYKSKLDGLPNNLETLYLDYNFNQELDNLPSSLKNLIIGQFSKYTKSLDNLPYGLENLIIHSKHVYNLNNLPATLKKLSIKNHNSENSQKYSFENLPENLDYLKIELSCEINLKFDNLPTNLRKFVLRAGICNQQLNNLPAGLKVLNLYFQRKYNGSDLILPSNLEVLNIYCGVQPFKINYPSSLKSLSINGNLFSFNKEQFKKLSELKILDIVDFCSDSISINLPDGLKYFKRLYSGDLTIKNKLPDSLEYFIVGTCFNKKIEYFPPNLKVFYIDNIEYTHQIDNLPFGLEKLYYSVNSKSPIPNLPSTLKYLYLSSNITSFKDLYQLLKSDKEYYLPPNLEYFGFRPLFSKDNLSADYKSIDKILEEEYELCWIIINNIPNSVKYLSMEFPIDKFEFIRLPTDLIEISINNRYFTTNNFNYVDHFKSGGCTNDFDKIYIEATEDHADIKSFNSCIKNKFDIYVNNDEYDPQSEDKIFEYHY